MKATLSPGANLMKRNMFYKRVVRKDVDDEEMSRRLWMAGHDWHEMANVSKEWMFSSNHRVGGC